MARLTTEWEELQAAAREMKRKERVRTSEGPTSAELRESKALKDPEVRSLLRSLKEEDRLNWGSSSTRESPIRVYKHAGYLVNKRSLSEKAVNRIAKQFTYMLYDEKACEKCEFYEDRHGENCDNCSSFQGKRCLVKEVEKGDETLISIPYGNTKKVRELLEASGRDLKIINRNPAPTPLSRPIRVRKGVEVRSYQEEAVQAILSKKKGIIEAPPRSGKTFLSAVAICRINRKTLILASQRDWLVQFQETFIGSSTQEPMTTAHKSQVRFCKTLREFIDTDICLATFQQFMSPGGKLMLERIRSLFDVLVVDEIHLTPALATSGVMSHFNAEYRWGLSGTPERKQKILMEIVFDLIGPIIYVAKVERLRPQIEVLPTSVTLPQPKGGHKEFATFIRRLELNKERILAAAKKAISAVQAGHMVLIPCLRVGTVKVLVETINRLAIKEGVAKRDIAAPFVGGLPKDIRKETIDRARSYKLKVIVGNIRLLSVGLNIPRASMLIEYTLSSNRPNAIQRVSRILTPMEGKPRPTVVFMLDESSLMRTTRRTEWWNAIYREFKPSIAGNVRTTLMDWFKGSDVTRLGRPIGRYDI